MVLLGLGKEMKGCLRKITDAFMIGCAPRRCIVLCCVLLIVPLQAYGFDSLDRVRQTGVLRHLGVPYAHFVTGSGDGLDVEMIRLFADYLGVKYEYVPSTWEDVLKESCPLGRDKKSDEFVHRFVWEQKGDLLANGLTILEPRKEKLLFSTPIFPSDVWLIARADSAMEPIVPSKDRGLDIQRTIQKLEGHTVLALKGGCLDPSLNRIEGTGALIQLVDSGTNLNDLVPLILRGEAESTLLDVPDALIEIQKWPGKIKIIGPLSYGQVMGVAFPKSSKRLRDEFNSFFLASVKKGVYQGLVKKYYPSIFTYYPDFFRELEERAYQPAFLMSLLITNSTK